MVSKYAKKRIKVDMKVFLRNCDSENDMKFNRAFKQLHFNLTIQDDFDTIQQAIEKEQTLSSSQSISPHSSDVESQSNIADLSKITVADPYSKIKQSIKNILVNRCGVKIEELCQFCNFDAPV
jgi:transcription initiation factor IIF auxiliary subunit